MSMKQWQKNKKKLIMPKDYMIFDGTEDDDAYMSRFTNTVTMDAFNPPVKLVKLAEKEDSDDYIDYDKIETLEKKYFSGLALTNAIMATISGVIENGDMNIFIVIRNKAYKIYRKRLKKVFTKLFPVEFDFIQIFSGEISDHKKDLRYSFSKEELSELKHVLRQREKEMEKRVDKKKKKNKKY